MCLRVFRSMSVFGHTLSKDQDSLFLDIKREHAVLDLFPQTLPHFTQHTEHECVMFTLFKLAPKKFPNHFFRKFSCFGKTHSNHGKDSSF